MLYSQSPTRLTKVFAVYIRYRWERLHSTRTIEPSHGADDT